MSRLGYALFDADNHFYETRDCFTRHIEAANAELAVRPVVGDDGVERIVVGDRAFHFMDPKYDVTNPPGSLYDMVRSKDGNAAWASSYTADNMLPAFQHRAARIELMDRQGIETTIMLPTLAVCVEAVMTDSVAHTYANLRAFNRWIEDEWGYDHAGRIITPPLLSLLDVDEAVLELDRVLELGARVVHLRAGPAGGRSPADPHYDPFWARLDEADVPVAFHIADSGYHRVWGPAWGEPATPNVREQSAWAWAFLHGDRPIMETLGALVYGNLFGRFPNLRVLSLENGAGWVDYLLTLLDKKKGMGRRGPWIGGYFSGRPSEVFLRHVYVSPYPEDDISALCDRIGADRVLFGSDYPHPEGLAEPVEFVELLAGRTDDEIHDVMYANARAVFP
ncbi:MAG: amidohydrolase [Acidimicrobiales bacterium]|nr:amidohydrolase [Acidimicrobiales bacterium]